MSNPDKELIVRGIENLPDDSKYDLCDPIAYCIELCYYKGTNVPYYLSRHRRQLVIEKYPIDSKQ